MFDDIKKNNEISYSIIDYDINDMDNIESMNYFLDQIGCDEDNIDVNDGTQVILKHPKFDFKIVIDSSGLGDSFSHGYDVYVYEE